MFRKLFGKARPAGAKVDTTIFTPEVEIGGMIEGRVDIVGGDVGQNIRAIHVDLMVRCLAEDHQGKKAFTEMLLASGAFEAGWVEAGAEAFMEFELEAPIFAPISVGSTEVFLRTRLDVEGGADSQDVDGLRLMPSREMTLVFEAVERQGFDLTEAEVETHPHDGSRLLQELDFRPRSFSDYGIDELELAMEHIEGGLRIWITVDRRGVFFAGGENVACYEVSSAELETLDMAQALRQAIDELR